MLIFAYIFDVFTQTKLVSCCNENLCRSLFFKPNFCTLKTIETSKDRTEESFFKIYFRERSIEIEPSESGKSCIGTSIDNFRCFEKICPGLLLNIAKSF